MALAELLRSARERRGLTLDRLADETKIPRVRLAMFEREGFRPNGGFYQRAQIRACARALSLDERMVLAELSLDSTPDAPFAATASPKRRTRGSRGFTVRMTTGCVVVIAIVGATRLARKSEPVLRPAESRAELTSSNGIQPTVNRADDTTSLEIVESASRATVGTTQTGERPAVPAVSEGTELVITSQPEGARVTVDGVGWGATPLTIRHLPEGAKRVRLTRDGYAASERVVPVHADRPSNIAVELKSISGAPPPAP